MEPEFKSLLKLLGFLMVVVGVVGAISYILFDDFTVDDIRAYVSEKGALSPLVFVVLTIFFVVFPPAPNDLMAIAAGLLFGFWPGFVLSTSAFLLGSVISFAIGRKAGRPVLNKFAPKTIHEYTKIFSTYGIFAVFIARFIPIISFDLVSYAAGIFKLNPMKFMLATFLGMIPNMLVLVKIGDIMFTNPANIIWYFGIMGFMSVSGIYIFNRFKNSNGRFKMWWLYA